MDVAVVGGGGGRRRVEDCRVFTLLLVGDEDLSWNPTSVGGG